MFDDNPTFRSEITAIFMVFSNSHPDSRLSDRISKKIPQKSEINQFLLAFHDFSASCSFTSVNGISIKIYIAGTAFSNAQCVYDPIEKNCSRMEENHWWHNKTTLVSLRDKITLNRRVCRLSRGVHNLTPLPLLYSVGAELTTAILWYVYEQDILGKSHELSSVSLAYVLQTCRVSLVPNVRWSKFMWNFNVL